MEYPTRYGLPINPEELGYDEVNSEVRRTNHHNAWTDRQMGRLLLTRTFRNLDSMQFQLPVHLHRQLHRDYEPPKLDLSAVRQYVMEAYEDGESLRYGTATQYWHEPIEKELMKEIEEEYGNVRL